MDLKIIKASVEALQEINAKEIRIYQTSKVNPLFDYAIVATAVAGRQMNGLVSKINEKSITYQFDVRGVEGKNGAAWLLVDLNDVIINLFTDEERARYDLDKMWSNLNELEASTLKVIEKSLID